MDEYGIPEDHIFSSRDLSFVKGIMRITSNVGVDVVLNSLSGEVCNLVQIHSAILIITRPSDVPGIFSLHLVALLRSAKRMLSLTVESNSTPSYETSR
jgi:NADPH:quinone reductase-like Zn-dependent oxidoreductase